MDPSSSNLRGPDGCRYDDSLSELTIHLVVQGIKPKTLMKASNTEVYIKSDVKSMSCTVEIVKIDKKKKPPLKTVIDSRFYQVPKFPGEIEDVSFKLRPNNCILTIRKKVPQNWGNDLTQFGL